jgi:hypothetical protein
MGARHTHSTLSPILRHLLGIDQPTSYLVLLGNDTEVRANTGFAGSYALITLDQARPSFQFQDIYVPSGSITDHIPAPAPLQQAFGHGTWHLANADWSADLPKSATTIRWFFDKSIGTNPDQVVYLPLSTIQGIIDIIGPVEIPEYQTTISPDSFYQFLQSQAEYNFFPGSTQKKDALTALAHQYIKKLDGLSITDKLRIALLLGSDFYHQNLLLHSLHQPTQDLLRKTNLAGEITAGPQDSYLLVESNLGANKSNCCIERHTSHHIYLSSDKYIRHAVRIDLTNKSTDNNPNPPFGYSGDYLAYLRIYIPRFAENISIMPFETRRPGSTLAQSTEIDHKEVSGMRELGFFHMTSAGTSSHINLIYDLPTHVYDPAQYSLSLLKQNGMRVSPQTIKVDSKTIYTDLTRSKLFTLTPQSLE